MNSLKSILIGPILRITRLQFGLVGRFLLISTFLEDSIRIYSQWSSQLQYMVEYRNWGIYASRLFLSFCMYGMLFGSICALFTQLIPFASILLSSIIVLQTIGYGLFTHAPFILRNLSLLGAVLLLYYEYLKKNPTSLSDIRRRKGLQLPGLPTIDPIEKGRYISLFGRIMLVLLFLTLIGDYNLFSFRSIALTIVTLVACILISLGYKAKHSALVLVCLLCVSNVIFNQWWQLEKGSDDRDFKKYDFFQTLSIIGGFLILAEEGPGALSLEKRKDY